MSEEMIAVDELENQDEVAAESEEGEELEDNETTEETADDSIGETQKEQPTVSEVTKPVQPAVQPKEKEMRQVTATAVINLSKRTATLYISVTHDTVEGLGPINLPNVPIGEIQNSIETSIHQLFENYNVAVIKEKEKKKVVRKTSTTKPAAKATPKPASKPATPSIDDIVNQIKGGNEETTKPVIEKTSALPVSPQPEIQKVVTPETHAAPVVNKPAAQPKPASVEKKIPVSNGQMGFEDFFNS